MTPSLLGIVDVNELFVWLLSSISPILKNSRQSNLLGQINEITIEYIAGEKNETIAPYNPGICTCVVWMFNAPDQYHERLSQVATPDIKPKIGDSIAASFVCRDQRSVKIMGRIPGQAMMGRKYVDQLFVAPAYCSIIAKAAMKHP